MGVARSRIARISRMAFLLAAASPLVATAAMAAEDTAAAATDGVAHFGTWGVDLSTRDLSVRPGDDFQRYAAGKWLDANPIPADKSSNSIGSEVNDRNQERLRSIITSAPKDSQLGSLYASYLDEARLEQLDAAPLKADLARVDAIKSKAEFTQYMAGTLSDYGSTLFAVGTLPDPNNPAMNTLYVGTSGMGLPDRDYYLLDKYNPQRDAYRAYIERTLALVDTPNAAATADGILAFETEIA
jgi:putative endopeptidase